MESKRIILFSLLMVAIVSSTTGLLEVYSPIEDPMSYYVADVAKYAVEEHNKSTSSKLVLVKVLSGEFEIHYGVIYRLNIKVGGDGQEDQVYQAVVNDFPVQRVRHLLSFTKLENKN